MAIVSTYTAMTKSPCHVRGPIPMPNNLGPNQFPFIGRHSPEAV